MARDEKLELLQRIPLFAGLDRRKIQRLGMLAEEVDVPPGKVLIRQGDSGADMMVLVSGQVRVERDGERLDTLGPGDFFGEVAIIVEGPRTATVTSESPARLLVVNHRDFHTLLEEFPEVAVQVLATLADRIRRIETGVCH